MAQNFGLKVGTWSWCLEFTANGEELYFVCLESCLEELDAVVGSVDAATLHLKFMESNRGYEVMVHSYHQSQGKSRRILRMDTGLPLLKSSLRSIHALGAHPSVVGHPFPHLPAGQATTSDKNPAKPTPPSKRPPRSVLLTYIYIYVCVYLSICIRRVLV